MDSSGSLDCSQISIDNTKIDLLNQYFQPRKKELQFEFEKKGPDHNPVFVFECIYEGSKFTAQGTNKNDCKKKIKTAIWDFIKLEGSLGSISSKKIQKNLEFSSDMKKFSAFRVYLKEMIQPQKPVLIIDLENVGGEKSLQDTVFLEICQKYDIQMICLFARLLPECRDKIIMIKRDDLHRDSADEGIRRIVYYLTDNMGAENIGLMTNDHFGQNVKDSLDETDYDKKILSLFLNVEEFKLNHKKMIRNIPSTPSTPYAGTIYANSPYSDQFSSQGPNTQTQFNPMFSPQLNYTGQQNSVLSSLGPTPYYPNGQNIFQQQKNSFSSTFDTTITHTGNKEPKLEDLIENTYPEMTINSKLV